MKNKEIQIFNNIRDYEIAIVEYSSNGHSGFYSIGASLRNVSDLVFNSLPPELNIWYINQIFFNMIKFKIKGDEPFIINGLSEKDFPLAVIPIKKKVKHSKMALDLYENKEYLESQIIICDEEKRFPWEKGFKDFINQTIIYDKRMTLTNLPVYNFAEINDNDFINMVNSYSKIIN